MAVDVSEPNRDRSSMFSTGRKSRSITSIMQFQTVMWRARGRNRTQADEAADTVVNVNDNVSGIQVRQLH